MWTLDYIWFDSLNLKATAALETVTPSVITPYTGLPNEFFPSDHLSLKAYFKFAANNKLNYDDELQQGAWRHGTGVGTFLYSVKLKKLVGEITILFVKIRGYFLDIVTPLQLFVIQYGRSFILIFCISRLSKIWLIKYWLLSYM